MLEKRNIVLITLDSVRADHCSFMGYHRETTPTISKMARKGLYFIHAIASGVATPTSMFGVHTGSYPNVTYAVDKLNGHEWRKEIQSRKTLAQVLSEMGYFTGAIHSNPAVSSFFGFNKGFKYFYDFLNKDKNNSTIFSQVFNKLQSHYLIYKVNNFIKNVKAVIKKDETSMDWNKLVPHIKEFIKLSKKENKPYFLWVLCLDTHIPYIPPKEMRKWSRLSTPYIIYLNWKIRRNYLNPSKISDTDRNKIINVYDDSILYADFFIKTLWDMLKDDDPIFIIHADHGEGFGEHGFFYHPPLLYEELIHVPLVIYNADVKGKVEEPVSLLGLAPTILELIGEENEFPSKSMLHEGDPWVISKVFDGSKWKIAVRMKNWKFITGQKNEDELYYLNKDPYEQENVIDEHPDLAKEMRRIVELHIKHELEERKIYAAIQKLKGA